MEKITQTQICLVCGKTLDNLDHKEKSRIEKDNKIYITYECPDGSELNISIGADKPAIQ